MKRFFAFLAGFIIKRPYFTAGILTACFLVCAFFATGLHMDTGSATFMYEDSKEGIILDSYTDTFLSDTIILAVESDSIYDPKVMEYLDLLGDDITDERYVSGVITPATIIKDAAGDNIPKTKFEIKNIAESLSDDIKNTYFNSELMTVAVIYLNQGLSDDSKFGFINNLETLISISNPPPGVSVSLSGDSVFSKQMQEEMGKSMGSQILLTILVMIIALALLFSYVRYRFLPIVVIAFGIVATFGIMVMAGLPVSSPVIGSFPVIIGLGIDYAVQFHSRFDEEAKDKSVPDAIYAMLTKAGPVHLIAMCTTAIGFLALLLTPIPMIAQFGSACIIGVVASFVIAIVLLPVFFMIAGYKKEAADNSSSGSAVSNSKNSLMGRYNTMLGNFAVKIAKNPVPVILIFAFIAVIGINFDSSVGINVDRSTFVPQDMPAKVNMDKVEDFIGSPTTFPVMVSGSDITDREVLEWNYEFSQNVLDSHPEITGYNSIATLLMQYNGGYLPDNKRDTEIILSMIPEEKKKRYLSGNIETVIEFETVNMDMEDYNTLLFSLRKDIDWYPPPPGITAEPTGNGQLNGDFYENIIDAKTFMTIAGFLMILLFLLAVYRRFTSLAPMIPVLMIIGWNALIMYFLGIEYTPLTACMGAMTIGIAMDYTILIMERCEEELDKGEDLYTAIKTGVSKIGSAITISGVTTLLGFSVMITSDFPLVSMFGQTTVITIFFSLIGGIVVMPAVVALVYRDRIKIPTHISEKIVDKNDDPNKSCTA